MLKINAVINSVAGNVGKHSSERYFLLITSLTASIFLLLALIFHVILELPSLPVYIVSFAILFLLGVYFIVRYTTLLIFPKILLTVTGLLMLDIVWYFKFMSYGPVLFFILIFAALILWVWDGKWLILLMSVYFLNIFLLYLIESHSAVPINTYSNSQIRNLDIYSSFLIYSALLVILLYVVKREFIRQKEQAIKSDKLKSAFLANMSHEIRTPMNAIIGFSELLRNKNTNEQKRMYLNIIRNSGNHLLRLINDIIDLSKIEAGDMTIERSDFSILALFTELKKYYEVELIRRNKSNVKIDFSFPDRDIWFNSDPFRIKQILSNLLDNSVKFTSDGYINFSCEKKDDNLIFSVRDTGIGIPEDDKTKIFDRFIKFDYEGMNTEGSGIGLSIVEKMVKIFDGQIWFTSELGVGSSFHVSLPYLPAKSKNPPVSNAQTKQKKYLSMTRPILIVEDDRTSSLLLLELFRPYNVHLYHVTDGEDALNIIRQYPEIGLVFMDLKLPFMDGYLTTKAIKLLRPNISVIALSAYALTGDREKAIEAGCDDYIPKPVDLEKLKRIIEEYIEDAQVSLKGAKEF
jgi:signal transduction histidine kinase/ActR/RegA family two-component response regulator